MRACDHDRRAGCERPPLLAARRHAAHRAVREQEYRGAGLGAGDEGCAQWFCIMYAAIAGSIVERQFAGGWDQFRPNNTYHFSTLRYVILIFLDCIFLINRSCYCMLTLTHAISHCIFLFFFWFLFSFPCTALYLLFIYIPVSHFFILKLIYNQMFHEVDLFDRFVY